ncbi:DUF2189 domain-containing protein [Imhoffiella purpurea]|uniref:Integral membrane-like protein n=1 Tax=Imhoffiella purpurea TaxID=1249627 RepID=W9V2B6_9GAMM|nr:DUF2189 domain-containing protein [Imhoffiella purpurea]EXJ13459.1 integral membrane-like protein [Imhoffiella purpurea]
MNSLALDCRSSSLCASRSGTIGLDHPWQWLSKGWDDLMSAPGYSLTYGAGIVLLSAALTLVMTLGHLSFLVPFLAAGFFLVAPLLAIGLYRMSANLEGGEPLSRCQAIEAFKRNQGQLGMLLGIQFVILQAWMLVSVVTVVVLYDDAFPTLDQLFPVLFLSGEHNLILLVVTLLGAVFALGVFCISAITVPMLIDRPVDVLTAMRKSVEVVTANWRPMLLWASLIVLIVGAGLVTFYLGLFLAVPLVGHATWHAYRDLVPSD